MSGELEIDEHNDTGLKFVNIVANKLDECLELMQKKGCENICISSSHGWKKGINLEFLSINYTKVSKGKINFKNLSKLKALSMNYCTPSNMANIEELKNLTYLYFSRWPYKDLKYISGNSKLQNLILDFSKFENLNGIEDFKHLKRLKVYSAPNLKSIGQIKPLTSILENVYFELCPKIESYTVVDLMYNLEYFYIARSAPIHSVQFLKNTSNLRYAYIGVEVIDKDIQVLKDKGIEYKKLKTY